MGKINWNPLLDDISLCSLTNAGRNERGVSIFVWTEIQLAKNSKNAKKVLQFLKFKFLDKKNYFNRSSDPVHEAPDLISLQYFKCYLCVVG